MWRPTAYREEDVAAFREAMAASPIDAVLIHAVYLLNCASEDRDIRAKSLASLTHSLRVGAGDRRRAASCCTPARPRPATSARRSRAPGETISEALAESEGCQLHLENTAGAGGTLGRSFEELAALLEAARRRRAPRRCLDSCHLLASGYDIRTPAGMDGLAARGARASSVASASARCTSTTRRPRSAPTATATPTSATGELGERGCAAFLSAPRPAATCPACSRRPGETKRARRARKSRSR